MEVMQKDGPSPHLAETFVAAGIAFCFYPMTIAPIGVASNGGALGLASLVVALVFAWRAFALNTKAPWLRRLVQLPLAALVMFLAMSDAYWQLVRAGWLGL